MAGIFEWLGEVTGLGSQTVTKILVSLVLVVVLWLLRWAWVSITNRRTDNPKIRYRWRKTATYTVSIIGAVLIGRVWLEGIQSLVTYFGLVSAGIAVALRDPIVNWFGWIFISWRRPFTIGDRIQIGTLSGDVIDIGVSAFSILEVGSHDLGEQTTGRIVHVPNGKVFLEPLTNITQGFNYVWNEIPITVTFESDWRKAKSLLEGILRERAESLSEEADRFIRDASRRFLIRSANVRPVVYTRIVSDGVELALRYVCEARSRRTSTEAICEAVLDAFGREPQIDFAYRTSRIFRQSEEGKRDLNTSFTEPKA